jgi:hypothetical protein
MLFLDPIKKGENSYRLSEEIIQDHKEDDFNPLYLSYIISFIQLGAELCKIDGPVNLREIEYFCSLFPQASHNKREIEFLFIEACSVKSDPLVAAVKIYSLFSHNNLLYEQTIVSLIKLALCDDYLNLQEKAMLQSIAQIFMLNEDWLVVQIKQIIVATKFDPSELINTSKLAREDGNKYFRNLIKRYHPDKFTCLPNITTEYIDCITDYFQDINAAYRLFKLKHKR